MATVASRPVFVLHRVGYSFPELHQVGFAHHAQRNGPERNAVLRPYAGHRSRSRLVHPLVDCIALQREDVFIVGLLPMNQSALSGAVTVVLQRRKEYGIVKVRDRWCHRTFSYPWCGQSLANPQVG